MRGRGRERGSLRIACHVVALAFGADGSVWSGESNVRLRGAPGMAVRRAVEGASLRLEEPACQRILSDFSDAAGRPLEAALNQLGETPAGYLRGLVLFYDGSSQRRCATGNILGGTQPGSRVIFVCPVQFFETDRRDKLATEVFIIHETLHSLGLGENPPAPVEIDWRVMKRCRERAASSAKASGR
jgi:hypothetical protein